MFTPALVIHKMLYYENRNEANDFSFTRLFAVEFAVNPQQILQCQKGTSFKHS